MSNIALVSVGLIICRRYEGKRDLEQIQLLQLLIGHVQRLIDLSFRAIVFDAPTLARLHGKP